MLRQIAILVVTPAPVSNAPWLDQLFDQERHVLTQTGLLTLAMDMPCRRGSPTLQRVWAETLDDVREADLVDNTIARLDALARIGPLTIVTNGGAWRDWPALKLAALRSGSDLGVLAPLQPEPGYFMGEKRAELVDLALWIGSDTGFTATTETVSPPSLAEKDDLLVAKTVRLYRAFLRFLTITGRMSAAVYENADVGIDHEVRRLRNKSKNRRSR
jgi:hypothetical protein